MCSCLLLIAAAAAVAHDFCERLYEQCQLRFAGHSSLPTFALASTPNDAAFTPALLLASPDEQIGIVNSNGVVPQFIRPPAPAANAAVEAANAAVEATNVTAFALTPTQFKPFPLPGGAASGIGHETFQNDRLAVARGRCVRVYITSGQVVMHGVVAQNIMVSPHVAVQINSCIVFRTS